MLPAQTRTGPADQLGATLQPQAYGFLTDYNVHEGCTFTQNKPRVKGAKDGLFFELNQYRIAV